jgi:hypothetical protein
LTGSGNVSIGHNSLQLATAGNNVAIGNSAGSVITTGTNNLFVGGFTGTGFTTSSNHIHISDGAGNVRIRSDNAGFITIGGGLRAQGSVVKFDGVYNRTSSSASNMLIATSPLAEVFRSTASSQRWKNSIDNLGGDLEASNLLDLPVRQFKFNNDYLNEEDKRFDTLVPGFVAEEVAQYYPIAAEMGEDGVVDDWNIRMIIPPMLKLIQDQNTKIINLEARLANLENN